MILVAAKNDKHAYLCKKFVFLSRMIVLYQKTLYYKSLNIINLEQQVK